MIPVCDEMIPACDELMPVNFCEMSEEIEGPHKANHRKWFDGGLFPDTVTRVYHDGLNPSSILSCV